MQFNKSIICLSALAVLGGCGGGGGSSTPPPAIGTTPPVELSAYDKAKNKAQDEHRARLDDAQAEAEKWLETNRDSDGVVSLSSGLQYKIKFTSPGGNVPAYVGNQAVKVHYEGRLTDGTIFDSTFQRGRPVTLIPDELIEGWQESLKLMSPGDEWTVFMPPELGYGKEGYGPDIPPNAVLIFEISLL